MYLVKLHDEINPPSTPNLIGYPASFGIKGIYNGYGWLTPEESVFTKYLSKRGIDTSKEINRLRENVRSMFVKEDILTTLYYTFGGASKRRWDSTTAIYNSSKYDMEEKTRLKAMYVDFVESLSYSPPYIYESIFHDYSLGGMSRCNPLTDPEGMEYKALFEELEDIHSFMGYTGAIWGPSIPLVSDYRANRKRLMQSIKNYSKLKKWTYEVTTPVIADMEE